LVVGQLTGMRNYLLGLIQWNISDRESTIMPIFEFWDFARIMAIRGSKFEPMEFFNISMKFLIDRVPPYWNFGTLAGLER
jgi:hypothetical protein